MNDSLDPQAACQAITVEQAANLQNADEPGQIVFVPTQPHHVMATVVSVLLLAWILFAQALAIAPASWMSQWLQNWSIQSAVLKCSAYRDSLGWYQVLISAIILANLANIRRKTTGRLRRFSTALTAVAAAITVVTLITYTSLVVTVAKAGAGLHIFQPHIPNTEDLGREPDKTITLGSPDGFPLTADLYLPAGSTAGAIPVVVSVHGGGFLQGTKGPNPFTRYLADHGYAVMDIDYRLASEQRHNWNEQVADVGCALTWLTAEGASYQLDASRVAMIGASAGGNLAINAGYMASNGTLHPTCRTASQLPRISAVIGLSPAVDVSSIARGSAMGATIGQIYVGGLPEQYPDRYAFVDSITHADRQSPPTLIVQGSRDHLVLTDGVRQFARNIQQLGVVNRYVELPTLDHDLVNGNLTVGMLSQRSLVLQWLDTYVPR